MFKCWKSQYCEDINSPQSNKLNLHPKNVLLITKEENKDALL